MSGFFLVYFKPGSNWTPGQSVFHQPLDGHVAYLRQLHDRGQLFAAGPLADGSGGLTILQDVSEDEARSLMDADPAVKDRTLAFEIVPWLPIAWDAVTDARVPYESPRRRPATK